LSYQIKRLDIENKDNCLSIFKSNQYLGLMVALTLFIGIL
jgi:4-hydroxybenzoate polyprenyltransferase